jgi:ATP/maltotriose-dependent transcriptional regulator MalT
LPRAEDPRARSAATYICSYALSSEAKYADASEWIDLCVADIREFDLQFAYPFAEWVRARIALGQRRFADAERALAELEDWSVGMNDRRHFLNARALRARLLLQTGDPEGAFRSVSGTADFPLSPSWRAEYLATRALALAVLGRATKADETALEACQATTCSEAHLLAEMARAIAYPTEVQHRRRAIHQAQALSVWDPIVCGVRSSPLLADLLAEDDETRASVEALYAKTSDLALARRAGFRTRTSKSAHEVLTPREFEVLSLIARGYTNREISRALYIADSTTKVHVRHILEKLGVRTRAEAVGRISFGGDREEPKRAQQSD